MRTVKPGVSFMLFLAARYCARRRYIWDMSELVSKWRITRIPGSETDHLGILQAPDLRAAIKVAEKKSQVTEQEQQRRLPVMPEC